MMIKTMKTICTVFLLMTVSFLSAQNLEQYIPNNAVGVMTLNLNHLNKKVNLLELQQYSFYDMMVSQMSMGDDEMMETFLTEPSKLGFNIMEKAYIFGTMDDEATRFGMVARLSDRQSFENGFLKSEEFQELETKQMNGFSYITPEDDMTIAWNDNMVMIGGVERTPEVSDYEEYGFEEYETEEAEEYAMEEPPYMEEEEEIVEIEIEIEEESMPESLEEVTEEMLEEPADTPVAEFNFDDFVDDPDPELQEMTLTWVKENLTRTGDNSMMSNTRFSRGAAQNDMHLWLDYTFVMKQMQEQQGTSPFGGMGGDMMGEEMAKMLMSSLYKDNYMSMGMNFNDGRWVMGFDQYTNPKIASLMEGSFDSKYNKKMMKYLRGDELLGIYHINVNTDKMVDGYKNLIKGMANEVPMYGSMAESALEILGIFIDEQGISNIFNGDMVFAVTGMQSVTSMETIVEYDDDFNPTDVEREVTKDLPEMTFMMSYGEEKDIMKFVRLGVKAGVLKQEGQNFTMALPEMDGMKATLALRKGILFVSNSQDLINKNFDKKYKGKQKIDKNLCKTMCQNAQVMYFDIPQMIESLNAEQMAGAMGAGDFVTIGKENFESLMLTTDKTLKDGAYHSEFSLNMKNKDTNSLKQLFDIINEVFMAAMGGGGSKT